LKEQELEVDQHKMDRKYQEMARIQHDGVYFQGSRQEMLEKFNTTVGCKQWKFVCDVFIW
jgi:hypothetical protein